MAGMSVIGIDFGNESCYVAVAKAGGIETIANDYSLRATPSCVAFSAKNRILGVAAKNQQVTNMKNTLTGFKRFLGRKYGDPHVERELRHAPYRVEAMPGGGVGLRVHYLGEEKVFTPEQVTAMLFTKLKEVSAAALQTPINDCVLAVPSYFTDVERRALMDAASVAGLNVLRLMNETTATALAYGIYKQDLPAPEEKPRNVVFVDVGHSALQVSVCAFHKGKLRVLAATADPDLGGRDIDFALAQYFCDDFIARYKLDARKNPRAFLRLLQEVEKIKKQMSANSTKLPLNIECFIDEKDVTGEMQRSLMESLCADVFQRVERCLRNCFQKSKLQRDEIYSVEIVGGSSRIPAIKTIIENIFGKSPSTTLNQDEAVSRGAALQCAMLSPAVRVREFSVTDVQPYAVRLRWDADIGEDGEMEVFPTNHAAPFSKMLTFYRKEPFNLSAFYSDHIPYPDSLIGKWTISDVVPTAEGESQKIKVKVRVNLHGIITVASATLVEKKEIADGQQSQENAEGGENGQDQPMESATDQQQQQQQNGMCDNDTNEDTADSDKKDKGKKKQVVKSVDLPIKPHLAGFSQHELNTYTEQEYSMQASDKQEKERADARNALEEYVYDIRGRVSEGGQYYSFVPAPQRSSMSQLLNDTENWLYEEGEDCSKQIYIDKLNELKSLGEPIKLRYLEWELRSGSISDYNYSIQVAALAVDQWKKGEVKYAHLAEADVQKANDTIKNAQKWLEQTSQTLNSMPLDQDPPITVHQIRQEKQVFESTVNPIINRPKPKEKTPPPEPAKTDTEQNPQTASESASATDQMDLE